jgi:hypothetical protein
MNKADPAALVVSGGLGVIVACASDRGSAEHIVVLDADSSLASKHTARNGTDQVLCRAHRSRGVLLPVSSDPALGKCRARSIFSTHRTGRPLLRPMPCAFETVAEDARPAGRCPGPRRHATLVRGN